MNTDLQNKLYRRRVELNRASEAKSQWARINLPSDDEARAMIMDMPDEDIGRLIANVMRVEGTVE